LTINIAASFPYIIEYETDFPVLGTAEILPKQQTDLSHYNRENSAEKGDVFRRFFQGNPLLFP